MLVSGRLRCPLLLFLEQNAHQEVSAMGMETCCTLGLLNAEQAKELKNAGLTAPQLRIAAIMEAFADGKMQPHEGDLR